MAYRYNLGQARDSIELKSVVGVCTSTDEFVSDLNEAQQRLMDRGNWFGTEFLMAICLFNGCVTWPRQVGTVLGLRNPCVGEIEIRNNWWAILGPMGCRGLTWDHRMNHVTRDVNLSPLYNDITCTTGVGGKEIRYFPTKLEDVGKTCTIFGLDSNRQPLQQKIGGIWKRGLKIIAGDPYGSSLPTLVSKITSVVRDPSQANMLLYEYDAASDTMHDLAVWEPTETNPQYRRSVIQQFACIPALCPNTTSNPQPKQFEALVKLEFISVVNDEDFLAIDDFTALKFMLQAIRLEQSNQDAQAEAKIQKAIQQLNFRDRNKSPGQQATIRVNPTGHVLMNPL